MTGTRNFKFADAPCPADYYCPFEKLESLQEVSVSCESLELNTESKSASGNDLSSIISQTFGISFNKLLPGESCTTDSQCFSGVCSIRSFSGNTQT